ncbi:hypothetical protein D3P06_12080 [Paracoccus aestuarii]|uniref:Uncharacterized protein n=1 Tax=Paracoccus aestuarii TaxID=453842 RepID=A0A418ZUE3_9RHOB|nr:hypothetical protein [Paracoccus aestuarii]RJL01825.1 hypothetical protein D3P06_12080 [Paracoccus aestuarii]WCQ98375.1 hypothetical protein JHW48_10625 [Paracoccus aestuarii]
MILPEMLKMLTNNARQFQERMAEWQAAMAEGQDKAMEQARQWQAQAMQQQQEVNARLMDQMEGAGEAMQAQWQQMQKAWEDQFATMQKQGEEMRAKALSATGGKGGNAFADWAETYAAQMVAFTQKMQGEAANAIATATEARAKSRKS